MTDSRPAAQRATIVVTQRERFGMTAESLEDLFAKTPGARVVYVDGNSPARWRDYLRAKSAELGFELIRTEHFLTPNQARNVGIAAATTEYVAFVDNDVLFTEGWLDRLVACADETGAWVVAPLTCQGLPAHTEIHHAGGDYAPGGDMAGFFAADPEMGRAFEEVMHGHAEPVADWRDRLVRQETGMCEFHCALARRDAFETIGPLDEAMLSTKEHIDFCMEVRRAGGSVWFEPSSVITYVFPCRARPMAAEDWPYFSLRWSNAYGARSLSHFVEKWGLNTPPGYVEGKRVVYATRRWQGILIPIMRQVPLVGRNQALARRMARWVMFPERLVNAGLVARQDLRMRRAGGGSGAGAKPAQ
jgi:glycosyltransferase involved in cell wall biosynthesis